MNVTRDGNDLVIRIPMTDEPKLSATGKTLVVASSRGNQPHALQVGKENAVVFIGVNAYLKAPKEG